MKYLHKIIFYILFFTAGIWACFTLRANPLVLLFNFEFLELINVISMTLLWPIFYIEVCELIYSRLGKNGKLFMGYAKSVQKDLVVATVTSFILASIYWTDSIPYNFSGIDLGFVGMPFVIAAIYSLFQMMRLKIAGKVIRITPVIIMLCIVISFGIYSYSLLSKNSSGDFKTYQAIWYQFTILFGSFFIFTTTSMQLYLLKKGKFELSEFKLYFLKEVLKIKYGLYQSLEKPIQDLNKKTQQEKARHSAQLRKKQKKRKKK